MTPIKKLFGLVIIAAFLAAWFFLAAGNSIEHIEDTNGPEDYTLQTINDGNIEQMNYGAKGFSYTTDNITNRNTYKSKKYSGVTEIIGETPISNSYTLYVNYYDLNEGNAKLVLTKDDKIVHEFLPNEGPQDFTVENARGAYISLRLAGESASFKLDIN